MPRGLIATAIAVLFVVPIRVAAQQGGVPPFGPCAASQRGTAIDCEKDFSENTPGGHGSPSVSPSSSGPAVRYIPYERLTTGPDGQPCVTTGYYAEGTSPTDRAPSEVPADDRVPGSDPFNLQYQPYPTCPPREGQPGAVDTPALYAARYWERVPLPVPKPHIAPGWAITGKLAYLETNGETSKVFTDSSPFGPLEIHATGRYHVDWGDGESSGPHSTEGRPWPNGQITHEYIWSGDYDVVVTQRWTATWRLGGESGTLRELRTSGRIDGFPAREIQAVVSVDSGPLRR